VENHDSLHGADGISLAKQAVTVADIKDIPKAKLLLYRERACAEQQGFFAKASRRSTCVGPTRPKPGLICWMEEILCGAEIFEIAWNEKNGMAKSLA
jgi:hypothetical protein